MKMDVILPAAGRISGEFAEEAGARLKALIPCGGSTILEQTLQAIRETGYAERIVLIGPREIAEHHASQFADRVLPESDTGPDNLFRGLEWLRVEAKNAPADRALVLTTDLPFLTADAIRLFLEACPSSADICVPAIRREEFEMRFPGSLREYVRLQDGDWTMGCGFLINPSMVMSHRKHLDRIFAARKSQIRMAFLLGLPFILRFLCRRLTVHDIETSCSRILACKGAAVLDSAPELAFDIDLPQDLHYTRRVENRIKSR